MELKIKGKTNLSAFVVFLVSFGSFRSQLTSNKGKPLHGRKRMIARCVENVQLINFASNAVDLAVEVLYRRSVRVVEFVVQKSVVKHIQIGHSGDNNEINILKQFQ